MTYQPKVYREQGGSKLVVQSGGEVEVKSGGKVTNAGTQASASADLIHAVGTADGTVADVGGGFNQGTLNDNFKELTTKLNEILAALRGVGILAP